jgi:hypothetical protein
MHGVCGHETLFSLYSYLSANLTRKSAIVNQPHPKTFHWQHFTLQFHPNKKKAATERKRMYLTYILYTHFVNGLLQQSYTIQFLIQSYKSGDLPASTERLLISSHPVSTLRSNLSCCCTKVDPKLWQHPSGRLGGTFSPTLPTQGWHSESSSKLHTPFLLLPFAVPFNWIPRALGSLGS